MSEPILLDRPDPRIVTITLNRPERLNAIDHTLANMLGEVCNTVASDDATRVVIVTGAGRGFSAGLDLKGFGPGVPAADDATLDRLRFQEGMASLPDLFRSLPQPVIAAVNGPAVGAGLALSLAADIRLCARSATFGNAAIRIGLSGAEMGMSYYLPRIVGTTRASDWMLTGRMVDADEAMLAGLVSEVVDDDQLMSRALSTAQLIAEHSVLGVRMTKRALQVNVDAPSLASALELENRNQVLTHATDESANARRSWIK